MELKSNDEYRRAMREFSELEGRPLSAAEAERKEALEAAIAAYSAEADKPDRRKGRPPGKEGEND